MTESPITLIAPKGRVVPSTTYFVEDAADTSSAAVVTWATGMTSATAIKTECTRFNIRAMYLREIEERWRVRSVVALSVRI
jgi:hypothetical protein